METLRIEIVNPKAKRILQDLADLNLITISKSFDNKSEFKKVLSKLRSNAVTAPSLDEITKEVESVRALRYAKKAK
jgi:predicted DNA-binding ArsR family transcriptional regulator